MFELYHPEAIDEIMKLTYENPFYKKLRENGHTQILGIWDDNDFGINDGESDNPIKHDQK